MPSVIVVDRKKSLERVVEEIKRQQPNRKIHRTHNYGTAMQLVQNQYASAILIDADVKRSGELCQRIKGLPGLHEQQPLQIIYFANNKPQLELMRPYFDLGYIKFNYKAEEVVRNMRS